MVVFPKVLHMYLKIAPDFFVKPETSYVNFISYRWLSWKEIGFYGYLL